MKIDLRYNNDCSFIGEDHETTVNDSFTVYSGTFECKLLLFEHVVR